MASSLPLFNQDSSLPEAASSDLCPSCGNFTDERGLNDITGWCYNCSPPSLTNITTHNAVESALAAHASTIEHFMREGQSVWQALNSARQDRPTCVVCGETIPRAKRNAIFCRKYKECRRYSRKYVYLYRERGKSKAEALSIVLEELTGG